MCNELQRQHEDMEQRARLLHLMELFAEHSRTQRYETLKSLFSTQRVFGICTCTKDDRVDQEVGGARS